METCCFSQYERSKQLQQNNNFQFSTTKNFTTEFKSTWVITLTQLFALQHTCYNYYNYSCNIPVMEMLAKIIGAPTNKVRGISKQKSTNWKNRKKWGYIPDWSPNDTKMNLKGLIFFPLKLTNKFCCILT